MTDRYREIYQSRAEAYDRLVTAEDADGRLGPALNEVRSLDGALVVEAGAGTGRLTRLMAARGARVVATDAAHAMLRVARRRLPSAAVQWGQADALALPVASGAADLAVAGWVYGHFTAWYPDHWREQTGRALDELSRALRPGGTTIVLETLGTATDGPGPPSERLADYYRWLEEERGFTRRTLATDYQFDSVDEAAAVCGTFFGEAMAGRIRERGWARVPEWTGLWWRAR